MCILFTKTDSNPNPDQFYLILANVRDEYYWRPTQTLNFWEKELGNIIGGKNYSKLYPLKTIKRIIIISFYDF